MTSTCPLWPPPNFCALNESQHSLLGNDAKIDPGVGSLEGRVGMLAMKEEFCAKVISISKGPSHTVDKSIYIYIYMYIYIYIYLLST